MKEKPPNLRNIESCVSCIHSKLHYYEYWTCEKYDQEENGWIKLCDAYEWDERIEQ